MKLFARRQVAKFLIHPRKATLTITLRDSLQLEFAAVDERGRPVAISTKELDFKIGDPSIARIDEAGAIKAILPGCTIFTAKHRNTGASASAILEILL